MTLRTSKCCQQTSWERLTCKTENISGENQTREWAEQQDFEFEMRWICGLWKRSIADSCRL